MVPTARDLRCEDIDHMNASVSNLTTINVSIHFGSQQHAMDKLQSSRNDFYLLTEFCTYKLNEQIH